MRRPGILMAGALTAALLDVHDALAQDDAAEASRRSLIRDAERARAAGDHARAVELMTRAGQVRMTPSLRLFLAEEQAELDNWLQVYLAATRCRSEATADPALPHRRSLMVRCATLEADSVRHVAFVVLRVPADVAGLTLRVAGAEVPSALWGARYPVAAAPTTVDGTTPVGQTFHQEFTATEGETREVPVVLTPPPAPSPPAPSPPAPSPPAPPPAQPPALPSPAPPLEVVALPPRQVPPPAHDPGLGPWIVMGVGGVVLASAAVFAVLRAGALEDQAAACHDDLQLCEPPALEAHARAGTMTILTDVALGVGAAALVGGVLWRVLARPGPTRSARQGLRFGAALRGDGVALELGGAL